MDVFVESLLRTDKVICDNIDKRDVLGDDLLVQNIVAQLRHFVEGIARLICSREQDIANNQKGTEKAIKLIKSREDLVFLRRFHQCLQVSAAHSTVDPDAAMRLMHRYWDYLQDCKEYVQKMLGLELLHNIDKFPLEQDETLKEYYEKIAIEVNKRRLVEITESPTDRYYVHKKKTFRVNGEKFYEITLSQADDKSSKFDNVIVFTKINIPTFYALHPRIVESSISILERRMSIRIVTGFKVSVRPCEFDNFFCIFGHTTNTSTSDNEYRALMDYLTITKLSLTELVDFDDEDFVKIKERVCSRLKATHIFDGLEKCREYRGKPGYNILIYLLLFHSV